MASLWVGQSFEKGLICALFSPPALERRRPSSRCYAPSAFVPNASVASAPRAAHEQAPCSGPLFSGAIDEPPEIEVSSLPLDDAGTHELFYAS